MNATAEAKMELLDVVDMHPERGEYVMVREMKPYETFGEMVEAFTPIHATRLVVNRRWDSRCEKCNHHLRYAHIAQDTDGKFHCYGRECLNVAALGPEGARKLAYTERISESTDKRFYANFNVPQVFWDIPKDKRPVYARVWKTKVYRRGDRPAWKLSIWGDEFEICLNNCVEIDRLLGMKLF